MSCSHRKKNKLAIVVFAICFVVVIFLAITIVLSIVEQKEISDENYETTTEEIQSQQSVLNTNQSVITTPNMQTTQTLVNQLVSQYGTDVSVTVMPLDSNYSGFNINGDNKFVSASMIKLLILAHFIWACDSGRIDSQASYTVKSSDIVGGTGTIQNKGAGVSYTYDELAYYMIKCSDNTATNILIDLLGMSNINDTAVSLELKNTQLNRKMMDSTSGVENYITANDAATILNKIGNKTFGSAVMCDKAIGYLLDQEDNVGLAQGLKQGVNFAHKTGSLKNCRHDGGIEYVASPYIIVCLCDIGISNGNSLMQQIGSICSTNLT